MAALKCVPLGTIERVEGERCQVDTTTTRRQHSVNLRPSRDKTNDRWAALGGTRALIDGCETRAVLRRSLQKQLIVATHSCILYGVEDCETIKKNDGTKNVQAGRTHKAQRR